MINDENVFPVERLEAEFGRLRFESLARRLADKLGLQRYTISECDFGRFLRVDSARGRAPQS